MLEGADKLIAALGVALASVLTPIGVMYAAHANRQNKASSETADALRLELERSERERQTLTDGLNRQRALREAAEAKEMGERASGLRWMAVAMAWQNIAHEQRHGFAALLIEITGRIDGGGHKLPELPRELEDILKDDAA